MPKLAKPTSGPLEMHQGVDYLQVQTATRGMFRVIYIVHYPNAEDIANAKLFLAAHDMAEALRLALEASGQSRDDYSWEDSARAALKKAGTL